jgi:hypothetical protein
MSNEYSAPGDRVRQLSMGVLASEGAGVPDLMSSVQSNLQYRIESARSMLMGGDLEESVSPVERRQKIRERRLSALRGGDSATAGTKPSTGSTSDRIGEAGRSSGDNGDQSRNASTPSMSEVNAGTKKRAQDQGYGQ